MDDLSLMDDQNKKKKKARKESYSETEIDQDCFHLIHVSCMVFDFSEETHKDNRAHEGLCS